MRLIQTDGRNRLIHTPRDTKRSKALKIVGEKADRVFRALANEGKSSTFLPILEDGDPERVSSANTFALQTELTSEALQKRILGLFRDSRTIEEEQGVNVLYLAIGFLRWFESEDSETIREAPLLLLPVSLSRTNVRTAFKLGIRDEDITSNLPLQERLREFGILLPSIPNEDDWLPSQYFDAVRASVSSQSRWSIDEDGMLLGFFSFSKFLMFRDLDPENWPNDQLLTNPLLASLLVDGFPYEEPLFPDDQNLDQIFDPASLIHVVDADGSQAIAIETVRKGKNLVIQGPPGTGKSQTITNIIAASIHDGKSVLFVAEKMAALNVVHQRLQSIGLGQACLELHSRQANKKAVIAQIDYALRLPTVSAQTDQNITRLRQAISYLNRNAEQLNEALEPSLVTPFRALGEQVLLLSEGYEPPRTRIDGIQDWPPEKATAAMAAVQRLSELVLRCGNKFAHPWRGVNAHSIQPADLIRLQSNLGSLEKTATNLSLATGEICFALGVSTPQTIASVAHLTTLLELVAERPKINSDMLVQIARCADLDRLMRATAAGKSLLKLFRELNGAFLDEAWTFNFSEVKAGLGSGKGSFLNRLRQRYRRASKTLASLLAVPLPKAPAARLEMVEKFIHLQELRRVMEAEAPYCSKQLGTHWRNFQTDFDAMDKGIAWSNSLGKILLRFSAEKCASFPGDISILMQAYRDLAQRFDQEIQCLRALELDTTVAFGAPEIESVSIRAFLDHLRQWLSRFDRLTEWADLARADRRVRAEGAGQIADALGAGELSPDKAAGELRFIRAEAIWNAAIARNPSLAELKGGDRTRFVEDFKKFDIARRSIVANEIRARLGLAMPNSGQELHIIRHEINKQRRHLATRRLIEKTSNTLTRIKPVFLMSPISVAQFLAPGSVEFDLLIIDEASQVRPEDALGAIARAKQVVIVGDKKQLPPTSFFNRALDDEDEVDEDEEPDRSPAIQVQTTELESILAACEVQGMTSRMLTWHYRSRHPSLIEVSNDEFYDGKLFLPPSPVTTSDASGLVITRVNGSYDRGGKRTNEIEAKAVVEAVARHAREKPDQSLGVVTFSISQRDLIDDLLEVRRREDGDLDNFISATNKERTFVKNLENVQGDERDTIIISIGYGPRIAAGGLDSMHFGPVSSDGGERRLNVLFTRARVKCEVFSSFSSGDIDLARTTKPGARVLKRFLKFAETGVLDVPVPVGDPDSYFEEAVGKYIAQLNYDYDFQVGSAGYRIDLAVKHPQRAGEYILAIECDGATYHSARWARERDRLRQKVLEDQGWNFHRVWSTDWFHNPNGAKARLAEAIEMAKLRAN